MHRGWARDAARPFLALVFRPVAGRSKTPVISLCTVSWLTPFLMRRRHADHMARAGAGGTLSAGKVGEAVHLGYRISSASSSMEIGMRRYFRPLPITCSHSLCAGGVHLACEGAHPAGSQISDSQTHPVDEGRHLSRTGAVVLLRRIAL